MGLEVDVGDLLELGAAHHGGADAEQLKPIGLHLPGNAAKFKGIVARRNEETVLEGQESVHALARFLAVAVHFGSPLLLQKLEQLVFEDMHLLCGKSERYRKLRVFVQEALRRVRRGLLRDACPPLQGGAPTRVVPQRRCLRLFRPLQRPGQRLPRDSDLLGVPQGLQTAQRLLGGQPLAQAWGQGQDAAPGVRGALGALRRGLRRWIERVGRPVAGRCDAGLAGQCPRETQPTVQPPRPMMHKLLVQLPALLRARRLARGQVVQVGVLHGQAG
mmetsp:Transcript_52560/g.170792  ORF Transcript_52560/g.170792 Transcript_52560/m.170792 type:complete len:274 (-) Transcript_52560:1276-2097(-)